MTWYSLFASYDSTITSAGIARLTRGAGVIVNTYSAASAKTTVRRHIQDDGKEAPAIQEHGFARRDQDGPRLLARATIRSRARGPPARSPHRRGYATRKS